MPQAGEREAGPPTAEEMVLNSDFFSERTVSGTVSGEWGCLGSSWHLEWSEMLLGKMKEGRVQRVLLELDVQPFPQMRAETPPPLCCGIGQIAIVLSDTWRGRSLRKWGFDSWGSSRRVSKRASGSTPSSLPQELSWHYAVWNPDFRRSLLHSLQLRTGCLTQGNQCSLWQCIY